MLGHPVHPALVHFPIALLLSATIADLAWVAGLTADTHVAAVMMAGGLAAAVIAMLAGMVDLMRLDEDVVPHATRHMVAVMLACLGYGIALYLRRDSLLSGAPIGTPAIFASIASSGLLAFGGWLGGRLVYDFGAGVAKTGFRRR